MPPQPVNPLEGADYDYLSASMRTVLLYCLCEAQFTKNKKFATHLRKEYEVCVWSLVTIWKAGREYAYHWLILQGEMREKALGKDSTGKVGAEILSSIICRCKHARFCLSWTSAVAYADPPRVCVVTFVTITFSCITYSKIRIAIFDYFVSKLAVLSLNCCARTLLRSAIYWECAWQG